MAEEVEAEEADSLTDEATADLAWANSEAEIKEESAVAEESLDSMAKSVGSVVEAAEVEMDEEPVVAAAEQEEADSTVARARKA